MVLFANASSLNWVSISFVWSDLPAICAEGSFLSVSLLSSEDKDRRFPFSLQSSNTFSTLSLSQAPTLLLTRLHHHPPANFSIQVSARFCRPRASYHYNFPAVIMIILFSLHLISSLSSWKSSWLQQGFGRSSLLVITIAAISVWSVQTVLLQVLFHALVLLLTRYILYTIISVSFMWFFPLRACSLVSTPRSTDILLHVLALMNLMN